MMDKLQAKAGVLVDWYAGKSFRKYHPVRACLLDASVIATWACWIIALLIVGYYVLSGNSSGIWETK